MSKERQARCNKRLTGHRGRRRISGKNSEGWREKRESDKETEAQPCHLSSVFILLRVQRYKQHYDTNNTLTTAFHSMIAVCLLHTGCVCFTLSVCVHAIKPVSLTSMTTCCEYTKY